MATRVLVGAAAMTMCVVAACSPFGNGAFTCTEDTQCGAGKCANGYCAFGDSLCPSGFRYGDLSGPNSGTCVGDEQQKMDAGLDAFKFLDAPEPGVTCYGMGLAIACFTDFTPSGTVNLPNGVFDTGTGNAACATNVNNSPPWCVVAAADITTATGTINVRGPRPLVLLATGTITISGTLDLASHRTGGETIAAGADFSGCNAGTLPTATKGGGGAGGSMGGANSNGGDGSMAGTHGVAGAAIGAASFHGGCPGQNGDGNGGAPGHGGGAVYLIANGSIAVIAGAAINASGEAGQGGTAPSPGGGGGGGAGGLIGLDAPTVNVAGAVYANGGGGAEGAGATSNNGFDGNDPGVGGAAATGDQSSGGTGGAGGVNNNADGTSGSPKEAGGQSGGGGGGSVGVIKLHRAATIGGAGTVSPPHS